MTESSNSNPLQRLRAQLLQRWRHFPDDQAAALDRELEAALAEAATAEPELLTVMNPTSRPQRLRLAVLVTDADLDTMYGQDRAELAVSDKGCCYLVYRLRDGGDYAIEWSPATTIPTTMLSRLSDSLALALFETDGDEEG